MYKHLTEAIYPKQCGKTVLADIFMHSAASDLGLPCLPITPVGVPRQNALITVPVSEYIGGEDRACGYNIMEKFDPKTDAWTFAPSMKRRRAGAGIAVCDGKIYVAGEYCKCLKTFKHFIPYCFGLNFAFYPVFFLKYLMGWQTV